MLNYVLAEEAAETVTEVTEAAEEVAETADTAWTLLGKGVSFWTTVAVLLIAGIAVYVLTSKKTGKKPFWNARTMAVGAMCMALSSVLSLIKLWQMPMGGAVTPASMLPLMLFAYCYGVGPGMVLGVLYGVMQFLLDGMAWVALGAIPNLLDYPIAFGLLGLAGLLRGSKVKMSISFVIACFGRFMASFLSGFIFYGEYAPEGVNPIWYAFVYNGSYMLPECLICLAIALLVGERLAHELQKVK